MFLRLCLQSVPQRQNHQTATVWHEIGDTLVFYGVTEISELKETWSIYMDGGWKEEMEYD